MVLRAGVLALAFALSTLPLCAQNVHPLPTDANVTLTNSLNRLVTNPQDVSALISAGEAALDLDDPNAAMGFFGRADDVAANNGRVKAGIGRSMLAMGQDANALRLMLQAESLGYTDPRMLADRGLARDLNGDQSGAQRDYQLALRGAPGDSVTVRRYAVSLGISGQIEQAEKALQPLLFQSDRGAWRDRAFILAMNGRSAQALAITQKVMPPRLAAAIEPYMARMHMLTAKQKAEAVHQGKFPPGLVKLAIAPVSAPPAVAAVAPIASPSSNKRRKKDQAAQIVMAPTPVEPTPPSWPTPVSAPKTATTAVAQPVIANAAPVRSPASASSASVPPPIDYSRTNPYTASPSNAATVAVPVPRAPVADRVITPSPAISPPPPSPVTEPTQTASASPSQAAAAATVPASAPYGPPAPGSPVPVAPVATESSITTAVATTPPQPVEVAKSTPAPAPVRTLASIMAELQIPPEEQQSRVAPVDLAEVARIQMEKRKAAEAKAKKDAELKAKKEADAKALAEKKRLAANPARVWVQIGTGRDHGGLAFTLKRMRRDFGEQLGKRDGWMAEWGRTNRLLVGPFASSAKAKDVVAAMKKAGSDAFVWNSDAGEEVTPLGGK